MRDYSGKVFGFLTVVDVNTEKSKQSSRGVWNCSCICGNIVVKSSSDLGKCVSTSSCGCYKKPKKIKTELHTVKRPFRKDIASYKSWEAMRQRCNNPNHKHYSYYGGRGIKVCEEWDDFWNFYADMGEAPNNFVLDRVDPDQKYCAENCRWIDRSGSSFNTRKQHNNTSGKTGVCWSKNEKRWVSRIDFKGKSIRLGAFLDIEKAIEVRNIAEVGYFGYNKE